MLQHHAGLEIFDTRSWLTTAKSSGRHSSWNLRNTLLLERLIAHRKNLIHQEDIGFVCTPNREGQTQIHTRRVELHLCIDKVGDLSEIHNRIKGSLNLILGHTQNRAVEVHVIAASQIRVETSAHLNQTRNVPRVRTSPSSARITPEIIFSSVDLRAVQTQKSHTLALTNIQAHAVERIELLRKITLAALNQPHKASFIERVWRRTKRFTKFST